MKSCESAVIQGAKREIRRCLACSEIRSLNRFSLHHTHHQWTSWAKIALACTGIGLLQCRCGLGAHVAKLLHCSILKCLYFQGTLFIVHACHTTRVHLQIVLPRTRERQLLHVQLCFVPHEKPCRFRTCLANHSRRIGVADVLEAADPKEHGELKYTHLAEGRTWKNLRRDMIYDLCQRYWWCWKDMAARYRALHRSSEYDMFTGVKRGPTGSGEEISFRIFSRTRMKALEPGLFEAWAVHHGSIRSLHKVTFKLRTKFARIEARRKTYENILKTWDWESNGCVGQPKATPKWPSSGLILQRHPPRFA